MKHIASISIISLFSLSFLACSDSNQQNQDFIKYSNAEVKKVIELGKTETVGLEKGIGKGVIEPNFTTSVYGKLPQYIEESNAKEGLVVRKGDLLFKLESRDVENKISKLDVVLAERELVLRDILIGQGYSWEDTASVPRKKMEFAKIKSGYYSTLKEKELALQDLEKMKIYAPCSGFIEDLKVYKYDMVNPQAPCCKIVNTDRLKVVFHVLETDLKQMKVGKTIYVSPIIDPDLRYEAEISRIIPKVNADGMVKVKAILKEKENLLPGMNVFVNL